MVFDSFVFAASWKIVATMRKSNSWCEFYFIAESAHQDTRLLWMKYKHWIFLNNIKIFLLMKEFLIINSYRLIMLIVDNLFLRQFLTKNKAIIVYTWFGKQKSSEGDLRPLISVAVFKSENSPKILRKLRNSPII